MAEADSSEKPASTAELDGMTQQQLNALPIYQPFAYDAYEINDQGEATLPNGTKLTGLAGKTIKIPRYNGNSLAYFVGPNTPLTWGDADGEMWMPVRTSQGWYRRRV